MNLGCSVCVSEDACDYVCWGGRVVESVWRGVEKAGVTPGFQRICVSLFPPVPVRLPQTPAPSNIPSIEKGIALEP